MSQIKYFLCEYLRKKSILPFVFIIMLWGGVWLFYFPLQSLNTAAIVQKIYFTVGSVFVCWFLVRRLNTIVRILLDILTGCQTKTIIAKTYIDVDWEEYDALKKDKNRYYTYKVVTENQKKLRILKDEKVCNFRLVKGNVHTICVLRYSNFLISVSHGKK